MPKSEKSHTKKKGPTPKGGESRAVTAPDVQVSTGPVATSLWVPVATVSCILAGLIVIILSFLEILPQAPQPQYNLVGLAFMSVGFVIATQIK